MLLLWLALPAHHTYMPHFITNSATLIAVIAGGSGMPFLTTPWVGILLT